jgi:hypothetical protein
LILRQRLLSATGLLLYVLTVTFASIDWTMSLDRIDIRPSMACIFRRPWLGSFCLYHSRHSHTGGMRRSPALSNNAADLGNCCWPW